MPIDYSLYPKNWKTHIRPAVLKRANCCCENCGVENKSFIRRNIINPAIYKLAKSISRQDSHLYRESIFIVLTIAHLNHDINDNRSENLAALCQRCHLTYDKGQHIFVRHNHE